MPASKHARILLPVVFLIALLYARTPFTYYCGFDDMLELHRMEFLDGKTLKSDFTVVPYESRKYRPLTLTSNRIAYELGGKDALPFRLRNLVGHVVAVCAVYGIAWLLFQSGSVAFLAALLFGIHPMVNQVVVGATWVSGPAYAAYLVAVFLFIQAVNQRSVGRLLLAMFSVCLAIFTYDATITVLGCMVVYLGLTYIVKPRIIQISGKFLAIFVLSLGLLAGAFTSARILLFPPGHAQPNSFSLLNAALFVYGPFNLIDPVLENELLDTPLPSEILRSNGSVVNLTWLLLTAAQLTLIVVLTLLCALAMKNNGIPKRLDLRTILFLVISTGGAFTPFLTFTDHPSESYVYIPLAFIAILVSGIIVGVFEVLGWQSRLWVIAAIIVVLFAPATWIRNERVFRCGTTAQNILTGLRNALPPGVTQFILAPAPLEPVSRVYGMYGYIGIDTLGYGPYGYDGIRAGIAAIFGNNQLRVDTIPACPPAGSARPCYWVHSDGRIEPAVAGKTP